MRTNNEAVRDAMDPDTEAPVSKRRESRAGARKVTTLSAEQLERKRANDREAQRTIRQRTKEHIEQLEHQVADLKAKGDQFDDVVRRNSTLENELNQLRHQMAMLVTRQAYVGHGKHPPLSPSTADLARLLAININFMGQQNHQLIVDRLGRHSPRTSPALMRHNLFRAQHHPFRIPV